jgi:hypothetical protein
MSLLRWLRLPAGAQVEVGVGCLVPLACLRRPARGRSTDDHHCHVGLDEARDPRWSAACRPVRGGLVRAGSSTSGRAVDPGRARQQPGVPVPR